MAWGRYAHFTHWRPTLVDQGGDQTDAFSALALPLFLHGMGAPLGRPLFFFSFRADLSKERNGWMDGNGKKKRAESLCQPSPPFPPLCLFVSDGEKPAQYTKSRAKKRKSEKKKQETGTKGKRKERGNGRKNHGSGECCKGTERCANASATAKGTRVREENKRQTKGSASERGTTPLLCEARSGGRLCRKKPRGLTCKKARRKE